MSDELTVEILPGQLRGHKSSDDLVASQIKKLTHEYLTLLGFTGPWKVIPVKKTGIHTPERFFFRHIFSNNPIKLVYGVRPGSRDTSWNIQLIAPHDAKLKDIIDKVHAHKEEQKQANKAKVEVEPEIQKTEPITDKYNLSIGQYFRVRVSAHTNHGLEIDGPDNRFKGFIPKQNLGDFKSINLTQFQVGKKIDSQVTDIKNNIPIFSYLPPIIVNGKEVKRDLFNTVLCPDGQLLLTDILENPERVLMICKVIATLQEDINYPITFEEAYGFVGDELKQQYGATIVRTMDVARLLRRLGEQEILGEKWLKLNYGEKSATSKLRPIVSVGLRQFAWERVQNFQSSPELLTNVPKVDIKAPEPVEAPEFSEIIEVTDDDARITAEIDVPDTDDTLAPPQTDLTVPDLSAQLLYLKKKKRFQHVQDILGQIEELQQEESDLSNWIQEFENKHNMQALKDALQLVLAVG
jgi:hypothetical protein